MDKKIKTFTDLNVWKEGHILVVELYKITRNFPREETFSLTDQMRRAATSITSNIAEGFGRKSMREKIHFYYLSQGSLAELKNQLLIARDVNYLCPTDFDLLKEKSLAVSRLLGGLIRKSKELNSPKS